MNQKIQTKTQTGSLPKNQELAVGKKFSRQLERTYRIEVSIAKELSRSLKRYVDASFAAYQNPKKEDGNESFEVISSADHPLKTSGLGNLLSKFTVCDDNSDGFSDKDKVTILLDLKHDVLKYNSRKASLTEEQKKVKDQIKKLLKYSDPLVRWPWEYAEIPSSTPKKHIAGKKVSFVRVLRKQLRVEDKAEKQISEALKRYVADSITADQNPKKVVLKNGDESFEVISSADHPLETSGLSGLLPKFRIFDGSNIEEHDGSEEIFDKDKVIILLGLKHKILKHNSKLAPLTKEKRNEKHQIGRLLQYSDPMVRSPWFWYWEDLDRQ